jgi:hypothetical protein
LNTKIDGYSKKRRPLKNGRLPSKRGPGRQTKLTQQVHDGLIDHITRAVTVERSCEAVGIHKGQFYEWIKKGEWDEEHGETSAYRTFADAVKKARARAIIKLHNSIAEDKDWKARAWLLERMAPHEYGRARAIGELPQGHERVVIQIAPQWAHQGDQRGSVVDIQADENSG